MKTTSKPDSLGPDFRGRFKGTMSEEKKIDVQLERLTEMTCTSCSALMDVSELEPFTAVQCPNCNHEDRVPARFGEFMLLDLINTGGMGGVYRARDESLGRLVAIKVMLSSMGEDEAFVERFKMEAQAAARLNHPKVAQIYSYGQRNNQPYIVMELVSGKGFDGMIEQSETGLDPDVVFRVGLDIAEGLAAADEIGLVHGDIKPENILLDEKGNAKLVDFGLASYADQAASEGIWGTPFYIAPEKVQRKKGDARSDIYSLGATLYHALAGKPPFDGETPLDVVKARLDEDAAPLSEVKESLSSDTTETIARMLQREPSQRHPTYKSVIADIKRILDSQPKSGRLSRAGGGGKKVVLKKKKGAIKAAPSEEAGVSVSEGGRIVVPKRAPATPIQEAVKQAAQPPEEVIAARMAKRRKTRLLVLFIVLAVVLAAGGITLALYMKDKEARATERRRVQFELGEAIKELTAARIAVGEEAKKTRALTLKFDVFAKRVKRAVQDTLGEALELAALPPPKADEEELPPGLEEDEAPPPEPAEVPEEKPEPEAEKKPKPPPKPARRDFRDDGREAPMGMPSRAAAERMRKQRHTEDAAPREAEDEPEPEPEPEPPEDSVEDVEDAEVEVEAEPVVEGPEIKVLGLKVLLLERDAKQAAEEIDKILHLADLVVASATNDISADSVRERIPEITMEREALVELGLELEANIETAGELTLQVEAIAADEMERRQQEREAEAEERLEQERQAKIARELSRAEGLAATTMDLLIRTKYEKAIREAEWGGQGYETEEGKAAVALVLDRCKRMLALRDFLVEKLNTEPFRWGWVRSRSQKEDVIGADKRQVILRDRKVPWIEVSKAQFVYFVDHYLEKPGTRRSQRGDHYLATAIYCLMHGGEDAAATYKAKALEAAPFLEKQADLLIPDG